VTGGGEAVPAVSVVVPTLDRPARAAAVVGALLAGDETPLEILVVDQSEGDETRLALERLGDDGVRHVRHAPPGTSGARNEGARLARGEYVAFVDDDVLLPADWLSSLRAELERFGLPDAVYGELRPPDDFAPGQAILPVSLFLVEEARVWERPVHPNRIGYSANCAFRRSVFLAAGGFDSRLGPGTSFPGAEDMDLGYRLLREKRRVATTPGFSVVHEQWREPAELPRLFYGYNVGGAAFCAKHLRARDPRALRFLLVQVRDDAKMLASALKRRSRLRARVGAARTAGTWSGLARGLRKLGAGPAAGSPPVRDTSPGSPPDGGS
jgi:glycosyltransferase involved in cell wall biosynthesis